MGQGWQEHEMGQGGSSMVGSHFLGQDMPGGRGQAVEEGPTHHDLALRVPRTRCPPAPFGCVGVRHFLLSPRLAAVGEMKKTRSNTPKPRHTLKREQRNPDHDEHCFLGRPARP